MAFNKICFMLESLKIERESRYK